MLIDTTEITYMSDPKPVGDRFEIKLVVDGVEQTETFNDEVSARTFYERILKISHLSEY